MSDELHRPDKRRFIGEPRKLSEEEKGVLRVLLACTENATEMLYYLDDCIVQNMDDGGMGGLYFHSQINGERRFGKEIVEAEFLDRDGVLVSAVVNLDENGKLFELDIWKTDFSPLLSFPNAKDIRIISEEEKIERQRKK